MTDKTTSVKSNGTEIQIKNIRIVIKKIHEEGIKIICYRDSDDKPFNCSYIPFEREVEDEQSSMD